MRLKDGMRISCVIHGVIITEALVVEEEGSNYICQSGLCGTAPSEIPPPYKYGWFIGDGSQGDQNITLVSNVVLLIPSLDTLHVGDKVFFPGEKERKVLAITGDLVALSLPEDFLWFSHWITLQKLKEYKLAISAQEEMVEIDGRKWSVSTIREALKDRLK